MNELSEKVQELLNKKRPSASDLTSWFKGWGNGDMYAGAINLFQYGIEKGKIQGRIEGSIVVLGVCGVTAVAYKGAEILRKKAEEKKKHAEMGKKIYSALNTELAGTSDNKAEEETSTFEVSEGRKI